MLFEVFCTTTARRKAQTFTKQRSALASLCRCVSRLLNLDSCHNFPHHTSTRNVTYSKQHDTFTSLFVCCSVTSSSPSDPGAA